MIYFAKKSKTADICWPMHLVLSNFTLSKNKTLQLQCSNEDRCWEPWYTAREELTAIAQKTFEHSRWCLCSSSQDIPCKYASEFVASRTTLRLAACTELHSRASQSPQRKAPGLTAWGLKVSNIKAYVIWSYEAYDIRQICHIYIYVSLSVCQLSIFTHHRDMKRA